MRPEPSRPRLAALLLAVAAMFGCSARDDEPPGAAHAPAVPTDGILLRGNGPDPDSLDPQRARTFEAHTVLRDLYECLTSLAPDASVAPGVASRWAIDPEGRTYTFTLRDEAKWSNGDAVVAADFVFALRRLVDPRTASQYAQVVDVIVNARDIVSGRKAPEQLGVDAPDDHTLVVRLEAPAPYLPGLLSHPSTCPVHRPTLEREGEAFVKPGVMVSNGAFVLTDWSRGAEIRAVRNRAYWNDAATRLEGVRYLQIADENAEFTRYRAGGLHITSVVPRGQFDLIRERHASELHIAPQLSTNYYGFNLSRAPFKDRPRLRQALSMVVDRERLVGSVLRVGELPAYGWVPAGTHDYTPQQFAYAQTPLVARIEAAQRLYAAEGYGADNPLRFELRYNAGEVHGRLALAIAAMWKQALGVEAKLVAVEFKSLLADIDRGDVEMFRASWNGDYNDAYTFAQYLRSDFGINLPRYRNPAYDALLEAAATTADTRERRELLERAERTMLADTPLMPLYFYVNKHLVSPVVTGWYDNVMNVVYSKDLAFVSP